VYDRAPVVFTGVVVLAPEAGVELPLLADPPPLARIITVSSVAATSAIGASQRAD